MMKTPDELNTEMAARLDRREEQAETIDFEREAEAHAAEVEAAKHPHHEGILHKIGEALGRTDETELRAESER